MFNPSSPSIHIQLLQTAFRIFLWGISGEKLFKDQAIFPMVINFLNPSIDYVLIIIVNEKINVCSTWDLKG